MPLPVLVLYLAAAGSCMFFSLLIIVSQLVLKIDTAFFLFGVYFFLLSLISLLHGLVFAYPDSTFIRELLILERVLGLSSGFPIILLIRKMKASLLGKIPVLAIFGVLTVLLALALIDLFLNLGLLFYTEPSRFVSRPLFRLVYVPFSFVGLGGVAFLVFRVYRSTAGKARKLLRTLSVGLLCLLPFEYWDLLNCLLKENLIQDAVYVYNAGVFLFAIFIAVFCFQLIRMQLVSSVPGIEQAVEGNAANQERLILRQIYNKIVASMQSQKLYLHEDLTTENLARQINECKIDVSKSINMFYKDNFNNFMNYFRVEELKKLLSDPNQAESIVEMGIRAGFNSKTSINRIFHRYVRLTPREFRKLALRGHPDDFNANLLIHAVKQKQIERK